MRVAPFFVLVLIFVSFPDPFATCALAQSLHLTQGWTAEERERFYFTAQGSQLIPFEWFLELEQVDSEKLFRDDQNMRRYGFLPAPRSKLNPEGLPVGFVRDGVNPMANEVAWLESTQQEAIAAATRFGIKIAYCRPRQGGSLSLHCLSLGLLAFKFGGRDSARTS